MFEQTPMAPFLSPEQTGPNSADLVRKVVAETIPDVAIGDVVCGAEAAFQLVAPEIIEAEVTSPRKRGHLVRGVGAVAGLAFSLSFANSLVAAETAESAALPDGHSLVTSDNHPSTIDLSKYTSATPEGMQTSFEVPGANKIEQPTFRVMSYNILRSGKYFGEKRAQINHAARMLQKKMEGAWGGPFARAERTAQVIENESPDVVGLQEATPQQIGWLKKLLHGKYASYPKGKPVETSQLIKKSRFKVLSEKIFRNPTYADKPGQKTGFITLLKLQDKLINKSKPVWSMNSHPVAHDVIFDRGGAKKRLLTNKIKQSIWTKILRQDPEANGVDISDSNSTNQPRYTPDKYTPIVKDTWLKQEFGSDARQMLAYCLLTESGLLPDSRQPLLQNSLDSVRGKSFIGHCKDRAMDALHRFTVDAIYNTKSLNVTKWRQIWSKPAMTASDHKPLVADMYAEVASTPEPEPTPTATPSPSASPSPSPTATPTPAPSPSAEPSPTASPTELPTDTPTIIP